MELKDIKVGREYRVMSKSMGRNMKFSKIRKGDIGRVLRIINDEWTKSIVLASPTWATWDCYFKPSDISPVIKIEDLKPGMKVKVDYYDDNSDGIRVVHRTDIDAGKVWYINGGYTTMNSITEIVEEPEHMIERKYKKIKPFTIRRFMDDITNSVPSMLYRLGPIYKEDIYKLMDISDNNSGENITMDMIEEMVQDSPEFKEALIAEGYIEEIKPKKKEIKGTNIKEDVCKGCPI